MRCLRISSLLGSVAFLSLTGLLRAVPTLPTIPAGVFEVTSYGAVADDGITDNTTPIQNALNAAGSAGGGTVEFQASSTATLASPSIYMTGPISVPSNINFQVDQNVVVRAFPGSANSGVPTTFTNGAPAGYIITIPGSSNVEFSGLGTAGAGQGTIDGNGGSEDTVNEPTAKVGGWWKVTGAEARLMEFQGGVSNILITNITLLNSPQEHITFGPSGGAAASNVTISGVTIQTPTSPNTDGMDPSGSHFLIENCTVADGDDNIALKASAVGGSCTDFTITGCTFGAGHGLSMGGQTNQGVNGVVVTNCTFNGTSAGFKIKDAPGEGGLVQNVSYSNCTMINVPNPIQFYSYYISKGATGAGETVSGASSLNANPLSNCSTAYGASAAFPSGPDTGSAASTVSMPVMENITVSNLTVEDNSYNASCVWGMLDCPAPQANSVNAMAQNITFNNVNFNAGYGGTVGSSSLQIYNTQNFQLTGTANALPTGSNLSSYEALAILTQPSNTTIALGGTASFSVGVLPTTSGSSGSTAVTPTYQWTFNGSALTNGTQADGSVVAGATSATLTVSNTQPADAGAYAATVTETLDTYVGPGNGGLVVGGNVASAASAAGTLAFTYPQGTYFGTFGGGQCALLFNGNGTGTFLAYDPTTGVVVNEESLSATIENTFSFTVPAASIAAAGIRTAAGAAAPEVVSTTYTVSGTCTGSSVSGTVTGPSSPVAFTAAVQAATGTTSGLAGFYQAYQIGSSANLAEIVNANGGVYALLQGSAGALAGTGTVSSTGAVAVTPVSGVSVTGTVTALGAATASVTGAPAAINGSYTGGDATVTGTAALVNTSGRANVGTASNLAIEGFVVEGNTRPILVIGLGPMLQTYGVTGFLTNPQLNLYNASGALLASNVGWQTASNSAAIATAATTITGVPLVSGNLDSAILSTLGPGAYTAQLSGSGATGVGLAEVFDTASSGPTQVLVNTSTRGAVGTSSSVLIHGFVVGGTAPSQILIRGVGPGLTAFGVTGALAAPTLTVYNNSGAVLATNTGWSTSPDAAAIAAVSNQVGAFALASGSGDSAVLLNLNPGNYTAEVSGVGATTGVALVEVYQAP